MSKDTRYTLWFEGCLAFVRDNETGNQIGVNNVESLGDFLVKVGIELLAVSQEAPQSEPAEISPKLTGAEPAGYHDPEHGTIVCVNCATLGEKQHLVPIPASEAGTICQECDRVLGRSGCWIRG